MPVQSEAGEAATAIFELGPATLGQQQDNHDLLQRYLDTPGGAALPERLRQELAQPHPRKPLRLLVAAEIRRCHDAVVECCEALAAIPAHEIEDDPDLLALKTAIVERCIGNAQHAFGAGDVAMSLAINRTLLRTVPESQEPVTELLLVHLYLLVDIGACGEFVAIARRWTTPNDRLTVLLAEYHQHVGNFGEVARLLAGIAIVQFHDPNYSAWHTRLKLRSAAYLYSLRTTADRLVLAVANAQVSCAFADYLRTIVSPDDVDRTVLGIAFYNDFRLPNTYETVGGAMMLLSEHGDDEMAAAGAAYFNATRDTARFHRLLALADSRPTLWLHPNFAKAVSRFAQATSDAALDRKVCLAADAIIARVPHCRSERAGVQAAEIRGRAAALGCVAEPEPAIRLPCPPIPPTRKPVLPWRRRHVFVGLFGQLRHEAETLPRLRAFIEREVTKAAGGARVQVHFALAVWDETGQRPIVAQDGNHGGADVLFARLPPAITELSHRYGCATLDGFAGRFPQTFQLAVELARQTASVDRALAERHFGRIDHLDINRKQPFQAEIDRLIAMTFRDGAAPHADFRNQLMMWERIGKFRSQIEELEQTARTQICGGLFMRVDLMLGAASMADLLATILGGQADRRLWVDHDPVAAYLEGVGDRYFIGGRRALLTVASLWSSICLLAERVGGPHAIYVKRLVSHILIGCFLFEQGISVGALGSETMPFRIHRGSLSLEALEAALAQDLAAMGEAPIGREVAAILARDGVAVPA